MWKKGDSSQVDCRCERGARYLKAQTVEPLTSFMDYIAREKMIDNVCMIIQGALNNKAPKELEEKWLGSKEKSI